MTTHTVCPRGPLISTEGITGVGKDYLTSHALALLPAPHRPVLLTEFSARGRGGLGEDLLGALRQASAGDPFLRTGTPTAEALLLLAIKRYDLDTVLPSLATGRTVLEGRSVDSTAVCQALLMHPDDPDTALVTAQSLLALAADHRPLPDLTILISDDPDRALERAQDRDRRVFTPEQAAFLAAAGELFDRLASTTPDRYRVIDRRHVEESEAANLIRTWVSDAGEHLPCLREPLLGTQAPCLCCVPAAAPVLAP